MNHSRSLNYIKRLTMTGVAFTMCGTVLALQQVQAKADTNNSQVAATESTVDTVSVSNTNNITVQPTKNVIGAAEANISTLQTTNADKGNYGYLDQVDLSNGQLRLSGWNANGTASDRPYHKIIVVDQNGHELGRADAITSDRPDVAASYANNSGALRSGWSATFKIDSTDWFNQPLRVVSRYSNDALANNGDADFWYTPITIDNNNEAYLDKWSFANGHFTASGWNTTNASYQYPSHWIILFDRTIGHEITRFKVNPLQRPDVANEYKNIYNSLNSGWQIDYDFGGDSHPLNDQLQVISRYSDDSQNGEGNHIDYWYSPVKADQGNHAYLDTATIVGGKLHVAGWHATSSKFNHNHHYILVLDSNGHEIDRQEVENESRTDVGKTYYGTYDANNSGWSADFDLTPAITSGPIQIISRYTSSNDGNNDYIDYWFAPITFNHNFYQITSVDAKDRQLIINGYHAADVSYSQPNHFLILFDNTIGRQVASVKTVNSTTSDNASKVNAYNAKNAGFTAALPLQFNLNSSHQYSLVLRYSADPHDNGNNAAHTDTWLTLSRANQGYLDGIDQSNGNLVVSGWNANDFSIIAPYHFIIIYDNTAHQQVTSQLVTNGVKRTDVAKANPSIVTAANSGFNVEFDQSKLQADHSYSVVSRYSTSNKGNGGDGASQDIWLGPVTLNQSAGWIDGFTQEDNALEVNGWLTSDQLLSKRHPYVIALYNGHEIGRTEITSFTSREDVAQRYAQIYNSANSGFSVEVPVKQGTTNFKDGNISFIFRVTDDPAGNGNYTDLYLGKYATNAGNIKLVFNRDTNTINASGWHASMAEKSYPYQYLIVLGADGHEFYRRALNSTNSSLLTSAGAKDGSYIANADHSGFNITLPITDAMNHWGIKIIHRYSNDSAGNGSYIDFASPVLGINDAFQHLYGGTVYYDPTTGQRATGWRTVNGNNYYFSDGYETQSYPNDSWVYNDELKGQMYTGVNYVDGHCYDFGTDGIAKAQPQNDWWSWPFPAAGQGSFASGQEFGYTSYKRTNRYPDNRNYYHDGLDFGAYDHPGSEVHAVHGAKVLDVNTCRDNNGQTMWWYIIAWDGRYLYVYQEAFQTRAQIAVNPGQIIYPGQVIGWRNTSHLHLGINTSPNYGMDLSHSFQPSWSDPNAVTESGTWLNPQWIISHGGN